jgi:putative membrane-bound dehydrogenase-like protein
MLIALPADGVFSCALALAAGLPAEEPPNAGPAGDEHGAPAPTADAAGRMSVPEGFHVTLAAAEPDVRQPIALALDDRGRIWIAECHSYPNWSAEGRDRILVLEDEDGDGRLERRKVFREGLANLSGIEVGFGGIWACTTPNLIFIPDRDGDDVPDGEPVVLLDGWDMNAKHNVFNGLTWGPDGWLYGLNGILSNSRVGRPGTPEDLRVPIN